MAPTTVTVTVSGAPTPTPTVRATPQGGVFEGGNPSIYNPSNPLPFFIIQAIIVISLCKLLDWPLQKIRQPRVIAEVLAGIILGPSVMGRIPGFTDTIFPAEAMPTFVTVASLGLCFFLFLVGLEVDLRYLMSNWQVALSVGAAGMILPFGLGCALAYGLYNQFRNDEGILPIDFPVYMLFIAVAICITAFPVLCRILTELKLLGTKVGIIVLSAGICNDVVGWILLALCVTLVNAGDGLTALWILLTAVGYTLFLAFMIRPAFLWILRKTRSLQDGPSQSMIALTLLLVLSSAFFTGIIGIHPIFGAFMIGLICPHEGGFAAKLTQRVEDFIHVLLLPLFFAISGLNTNLGLLNSGITWAYVVGTIAVAFFAKVIGGTGAARLCGLRWRECFAIGALMSCKGVVELIVLNIGLQAQILSDTTFTIFVVMALTTTFATTPLTSWIYPVSYQKKIAAWKRGEIDWETGRSLERSDDSDGAHTDQALEKTHVEQVNKLMVYLRLDSMPGLLALTSLFGGSNERAQTKNRIPGQMLQMHGLRLIQLNESSPMEVSELEELSSYDPLINSLRTFGQLHNVPVSGEVAVVPQSFYADTLTSRASDLSSDLLLVPWSETGGLSDLQAPTSEAVEHRLSSGPYQELVHDIVQNASCSVAVFVNNSFGVSNSSMSTAQEHHIFVAYTGSPDDRAAVRFILQLARDSRIYVSIFYLNTNSNTKTPSSVAKAIKGLQATEQELPREDENAAWLAFMRTSLPEDVASRTTIESCNSSSLTEDLVSRVRSETSTLPQGAGNLVVLGRNARENEASVLGGYGDAVVDARLSASLLVVQANRKERAITTLHIDG